MSLFWWGWRWWKLNLYPMNIRQPNKAQQMNYRKYDQKTMFLISKSKNPNLFPKLNTPRLTALYCIKNKINLTKPLKPKDCRVSQVEILRSKLSSVREENRKISAHQIFIKLAQNSKPPPTPQNSSSLPT